MVDENGNIIQKRTIGEFQALVILSVLVTVYAVGMLLLHPYIPRDWELFRYLIEKSINGLVSTIAILWAIWLAEWITPNDWMEKISENPIACAVVYGVLIYAVATVWVYG